MKKLNRKSLQRLIIKELSKMKEDSLRISYDDPDREKMRKRHSMKTCHECGSSMYENETSCSECGSMYEAYLSEGDCGCSSGCDCRKSSDYSLDSVYMMNDIMTSISGKKDDRHHNEYMAKPSLYKVAKYANKLLSMIPEGYELDDWQRTKIAQIADDISEVYHSLDYKKHKGEL